ncbi:MAG: S1 RNA-binding domain-containing protein [Clostridia bacterium]|nr:S1 RNA-binding domain-containing protein [Clostridia bacterium]
MTKNKYLVEGSLISTHENKEYISSLSGLERARAEGKILEGIVTKCDTKTLSLHLDLYGIEGVIYKEECVYGVPLKDIAVITRVGKAVAFKVMQIEKDEKGNVRAILSRREAQRECMENYLMDLVAGDIIPAKITHFEPFGAFLDIGCGIASLMSVDSVSVSRISSPRDRFFDREELKVVVKSIDYETGRIYVSTKELFGTWEENVESYSAGQTVSGIVRSVEDYGIFVELAPNLAGLAETKDGVKVGERCAVYIKSIMPEKMKIKLVIIDTYDKIQETDYKKHYYIDTDKVTHIDRWCYSPKECTRVVETVFN